MLQRLRPDIKADEYAALLEVKGLLAEGNIRIRMTNSNECIGACMAKEMGLPNRAKYVGIERSQALQPLFFPSSGLFARWVYKRQRIAPAWLLIRAIDRFLAYKSPWSLF